MTVLLFLDTDQNADDRRPATLGADYLIELDPGSVVLAKWNGTDYATAPSQSSLTFAYDATGATIHVSASDLSKTKGINLQAFAISGITIDASGNPDFTNSHADTAPDQGHGFYSYKVVTKLTLSVLAFTTTPKPAKHGKAADRGPRGQRERHRRPGSGGHRRLYRDDRRQACPDTGPRLEERDRGVLVAAAEDVEGQDDPRDRDRDGSGREGRAQLQRQDHLGAAREGPAAGRPFPGRGLARQPCGTSVALR